VLPLVNSHAAALGSILAASGSEPAVLTAAVRWGLRPNRWSLWLDRWGLGLDRWGLWQDRWGGGGRVGAGDL
jgi:hypothetical protein